MAFHKNKIEYQNPTKLVNIYNYKATEKDNLNKNKKLKLNEIDIVYTYVDSSDKKWLKKMLNYKKEIGEITESEFNDKLEDRYETHDEIYFSIESIEKFYNSVRNIYIVTDKQKLKKAKLSKWANSKIQYIDHTDMIPSEFLPTFNSTVIEAFFHKIPKLSETFLYFNDDMFLGNHIKIDDIFSYNSNMNVLYYVHDNDAISTKVFYKINYPNNTRLAFLKKRNLFFNIQNYHGFAVLNTNAYEIAWKNGKQDLITSFRQIRNKENTINTWLYTIMYGIYHGLYVAKPISKVNLQIIHCNDDKLNLIDGYNYIYNVFKNKPLVLCINSILNSNDKFAFWDLFRKNYIKLFDDPNGLEKILPTLNKLQIEILKKYLK